MSIKFLSNLHRVVDKVLSGQRVPLNTDAPQDEPLDLTTTPPPQTPNRVLENVDRVSHICVTRDYPAGVTHTDIAGAAIARTTTIARADAAKLPDLRCSFKSKKARYNNMQPVRNSRVSIEIYSNNQLIVVDTTIRMLGSRRSATRPMNK